MTLKQLEYFLAIAENGSITKAANTLRISQPPLSLQLKGLEDELGCQLFIRDKKNMIITPKGMLLREKAREIMNKVDETILLMQAAEEENHVTIHIGTISSICNRVLPDKILTLKSRFPNLDFVLHEGSTTSILEMLSNGEVEFGIVREPFNLSAYSSKIIKDSALGEEAEDYFVALAKAEFFPDPTSQMVSLTSLRDKPIIIHRRYNDLFATACRQRGFVPKIICQNENIASSLSWASSGIGIAVAPFTCAIQNLDPSLISKRIDSPTIASKAHLVWNKHATLTEEMKALIQLFNEK